MLVAEMVVIEMVVMMMVVMVMVIRCAWRIAWSWLEGRTNGCANMGNQGRGCVGNGDG